jgi:hypothetical protein
MDMSRVMPGRTGWIISKNNPGRADRLVGAFAGPYLNIYENICHNPLKKAKGCVN